MNLPQDNDALRTRINMTLEAYGLSTVSQRAEDNCIDALLALAQSEQTRLKAEADNHPSTQRGYQMGYAAGKAELIAKVRELLPKKPSNELIQASLQNGKPQQAASYNGFAAAIAQVSAALDTLERGA